MECGEGNESSKVLLCSLSLQQRGIRGFGESTGSALLNFTEFSSQHKGPLQPSWGSNLVASPKKNFQYRDLCPGITGKASPVQLSLDGAEQRQSCFPHKHPWNGISGIRVVRSTGNGNPPHQNGIKILCQLNNHIYSLIIHLVSALIAGMVCAK